jgi:hypothetical protein
MGSYTFTLDKFHIDDTRALHNDTDVVSFGIKVGNNTFEPQIKHMGDVNNGDHHVGLQFGPVEIDDPATSVVITYSIVNAGNKTVDDELKTTSQTAMAKADAETEIDGTPKDGTETDGSSSWWKKLWDIAAGDLIAALTADCDGPVATNRIVVTASAIDQQIAGNDTVSLTKSFPGVDSPHGCGGNSRYSVTHSISRTGPAAGQGGSSNVEHGGGGAITTVVDLNGRWAAGGSPGPVITATSTSLTVDMSAYHRPAAHGSIINPATITVTFPDDATYTGKLQAPGTIVWSNHSTWTKVP